MYFPVAKGGFLSRSRDSKEARIIINNCQEPVRGVINHPTEATNLLKTPREALFAIKSAIESSNVLNDQAEVQRMFAILKYINTVVLSTRQLKLLRNTMFQL